MNDLLELAAVCERAMGHSRELDAKIFERLGLTALQERHCKDWCSQNGRADLTRAMYISAWAPDFTRSIDAAMTLVPKGMRVLSMFGPDVSLVTLHTEPFGEIGAWHSTVKAATPALALCAASIRAIDGARG